jgi:hypothetical protein
MNDLLSNETVCRPSRDGVLRTATSCHPLRRLAVLSLMYLAAPAAIFAAETATRLGEGGLRAVEQYNFSIHILAMLLMGFGFLMVFVRNYGYSALTGTYLVVDAGLPLYLLLRSTGVISAEPVSADCIRPCCWPNSPARRR